jgi:trehalose synthase
MPFEAVSSASEPELTAVSVPVESFAGFGTILDADEYDRLLGAAEDARQLLAGKAIWNVTSTARGGGVAEMLTSLLPLARGAGVDVRWLVIQAGPDFFRLTKRIHNRLHGISGDGGGLGPAEHALYQEVLERRAEGLVRLVDPRDVVILHDPQTAGLAPALLRTGVTVIWRCHVGVDVPSAVVDSAWDFLLPYLEGVHAHVFTRSAYAPAGLDRNRVVIIPPSIDAFSPKNQSLAPDQVSGILQATGLVTGPGGRATFTRMDDSAATVTRHTDLCGGAPVPEGAPIVTQISRWDALKDPQGLVRGFVDHVVPRSAAHLVVAGPAVAAVSDDPEGAAVLADVSARWAALAPELRARVHLACVPMDDVEENAAIVNALQRRAAIVVQKSLAEGFGLTVAEAMWKERAIVASRVGGIQDQIVDGVTGLLVEPTDLAAYGDAVCAILADPALAARLGHAAHRRCRDEYLGSRHLMRYLGLLEVLLAPIAAAELTAPGFPLS